MHMHMVCNKIGNLSLKTLERKRRNLNFFYDLSLGSSTMLSFETITIYYNDNNNNYYHDNHYHNDDDNNDSCHYYYNHNNNDNRRVDLRFDSVIIKEI